MISDLKFAFRQLAKFPGYSTVVVLTLAFGIAVNTQIFAIVSDFFLRPMPVRDPGRLTVVVERSELFSLPHGLSFPDFQDLRAGSKNLTDAVAYFFNPVHVSIRGQAPERMWIEAVTPDAFAKLGVATVLGRPLQPGDGELPPGTPVAVLTHRTWQNRFGGDPSVVGRTVVIDTKPFTIVGVAQPGFESFSYAISVGLFVPSGTLPSLRPDLDSLFKFRSAKAWRLLAYRRPESTMAEVNAELAVFAQRLTKDFPADHQHSRFQAVPEQRARPDPALCDLMPVLAVLFSGLVSLVLLIACANVANLMGARALSREKELVVRAALGASRWRLLRQLLVESLLLAALAGLAGFFLAWFGGDALQHFLPRGDVPIRTDRSPGPTVWLFTTAISLVAGFIAGIMPALRSSRIDLVESLKQGASRQAGGGRHRLRNLLVIGQVAVSCVVLIAAALFLRGLQAARELNLGFRPDHLIMLSLDLGLQGYDRERGLRFEKQLLEQVRVIPGVESAHLTQHVPFNNAMQIREAFPDQPSAAVPDGRLSIAYSAVTPGFVSSFGVPLLRGRDLAVTDDEKSPAVAVINEAMARAFWPGREAIGQHFHRDWLGGPPIEVVGVVPTGKYVMLSEDARPYYYVPMAQIYGMPASLVVRAANDPRGLAKSLRDAVRAVDPDLPVYDLITMEDHLSSSFFALMPLRAGAMLAGAQGLIALLLAVLGLYSVVSYGVTSRTREIGVRMALGASSQNVMQLVSRQGLRLTLAGLGIGVVLAAAGSFGLARVVFGIRSLDVVAFPAALGLLLATAALACWLPARRATKVDPMIALRAE